MLFILFQRNNLYSSTYVVHIIYIFQLTFACFSDLAHVWKLHKAIYGATKLQISYVVRGTKTETRRYDWGSTEKNLCSELDLHSAYETPQKAQRTFRIGMNA